ncbi:MAG: hypothetical protein GF330_12130 [Candidatus Eisenbacteria bacterium]|nr:hypothetical protein [Candidatus Eisenbacteria bacterium]
MTPFRLAALLCVALIIGLPCEGQMRWLDDSIIDEDAPSMDRLVVDVKEDNSAWYALVSGDQMGESFGWHRSLDAGGTWSPIYASHWSVDDAVIGGAYGFDQVMSVWQPYWPILFQTYDPSTGSTILSGELDNPYPFTCREIVVDSNAETSPADVFNAVVHMVDEATGEAIIKGFHTEDYGATWTDAGALDAGPPGQPEYFGDIDLVFAVAGFPYFHIVYHKNGRIWHVGTTNGGLTWGAPSELVLDIADDSQVSVAAFGVYALAVGESPTGQVVYCYSEDAGATWSNARLIDDSEAGPRLPSVCRNSGAWHCIYRKSDGRLACRSTASPAIPTSWSDEEYATIGPTDRAISTRMSSDPDGNVGIVFSRSDQGHRPYFASMYGEFSGVAEHPASVAVPRLQACPTPSRGSVTVILSDGLTASGWGGQVLDAAGRLVAELPYDRGTGSELLRWDGRDAAGNSVDGGRYYIRIATPQGQQTAAVTILR